MGRQLPGDLVLAGVRPEQVTARVVLHLERSAADLAISAVIILSARQGFDLNAVSCEPP